ncbi:MAG: tyrosine-type recombinase/integrase [Spirochaetes bacterium]|nr:tyrosine-type recombinase/integrase [Spirochaetota bacterium]
MNPYPFSIYIRKNSKFYYVKFKNDNGQYSTGISTGKTNKQEAIKTAFEWYYKGKPKKGETVSLSLKQKFKEGVTKEETIYILNELKKTGLIKHYVLDETKAAINLIEFLLNFWDYDSSPFVKEKLRKNHSIHRQYCYVMENRIKKYWQPYFQKKLLGELTKQDLETFIDYIATKQISALTKNNIINAGKQAIKWAYNKEYIDKDITTGVVLFSGKSKERQILSPETAMALFKVKWKDKRTWLGNLLASVTGLRLGEIQALQIQDIGKDQLYIRHSFNKRDNLKVTKNTESRIVELPFPDIIQNLLLLASENPHGAKPDSFVFWDKKSSSKPADSLLFLRHLKETLIATGMSEESASVYTFHGWRHYFVVYMKDRISDKLLQDQTGHKTIQMLNHYADHRLESDKAKIQEAQKEVFGELVQFNKK